MTRRVAVLLAALLVTDSCHHPPTINLPTKGVEVEVKVKVGKEALSGGEAPGCQCAVPGAARCCTCRGPR